MKKDDKGKNRTKEIKESRLEEKTAIIYDFYDDLIESERKSSSLAIRVGIHLLIAKKLVRKEKLLWKIYCEKTLSDIPPYEIRDCMYTASRYQENPLPCLLRLNRTNLKKFFQFCKGKSPKTVLSENSIDLIDKDVSEEEIRIFRVQVLRLLQATNKKKAAAKKQTNRKAVKKSSDIADAKSNTLRYYREGVLQLMEED